MSSTVHAQRPTQEKSWQCCSCHVPQPLRSLACRHTLAHAYIPVGADKHKAQLRPDCLTLMPSKACTHPLRRLRRSQAARQPPRQARPVCAHRTHAHAARVDPPAHNVPVMAAICHLSHPRTPWELPAASWDALYLCTQRRPGREKILRLSDICPFLPCSAKHEYSAHAQRPPCHASAVWRETVEG